MRALSPSFLPITSCVNFVIKLSKRSSWLSFLQAMCAMYGLLTTVTIVKKTKNRDDLTLDMAGYR